MTLLARYSNRMRLFAIAALFTTLAACGGGGDDAPPATALTVTPNSLSFTPPAVAPKTQSKLITANFGGDFVLVGYAPGITPPAWIGTVATGPATGTAGARSVTFTIPVNATGLAAGNYAVTLRVVTGKGTYTSNPTGLNYVEVPITMTVL
jgi:hypothetical protein